MVSPTSGQLPEEFGDPLNTGLLLTTKVANRHKRIIRKNVGITTLQRSPTEPQLYCDKNVVI